MKKSTLILILTIVAVLITVWQINKHYEIYALNEQKEYEKEEGCFRVMTYNVNATLGDKDSEAVDAGLIKQIKKQSPDILCLQEVSSINVKNIFRPLDSIFRYSDSVTVNAQPTRYFIFSKNPVRLYKRYPYIIDINSIGLDSIMGDPLNTKFGMPVYSAEIEIEPGRFMTFVSVHLRSSAYSTARRSMEEDKSWIEGLPLYYENYKTGVLLRNYEADNIRRHLEPLEAEDTPIIIAGDFNDWSGSYCMNTIRNGLYKDAWWEGGSGFGFTYDAWHLKLRLDHILYSHHFLLKNIYVEQSDFSDHYPLIADFKLITSSVTN